MELVMAVPMVWPVPLPARFTRPDQLLQYGEEDPVVNTVDIWGDDLDWDPIPHTYDNHTTDILHREGTLSIEKAGRLLGFAPKYSLESGLAEYIDFVRRHNPRLLAKSA